jgi:hypothetical protein
MPGHRAALPAGTTFNLGSAFTGGAAANVRRDRIICDGL